MKLLKYTLSTLIIATSPAMATDYSCEIAGDESKTIEIITEASSLVLRMSGGSYEVTNSISYGVSEIFVVNQGKSGFALVDIDLRADKIWKMFNTEYHPAYINVDFFGFPGIQVKNSTKYLCRKL